METDSLPGSKPLFYVSLKQLFRLPSAMPNQAPLRIMHVLLSRGFAGSERSTAESCNQQCQTHEVCLVIRKGQQKNGAGIADHLDERVHVIEISPRLFTQRQLGKAISDFQPDVIHCHLRRSTRLIAKLAPEAATASTLHIEVNGPHFLDMDGLICNARWQVEAIPPSYKGRVFKASNSLMPHPRLSDDRRLELRKELYPDDDAYLIGAVGRYHRSKGWDTLIEAFKPIKAKQARLLFFGSGRQEEALKTLAGEDDRIRFIGYRKDIKDIYQCLDLLVVPSRFEPLPRVMLEGYDAGTPIIASDEGGCQELIDDYGGWSFPVDDVTALRSELEHALAKRPPRHHPDLSAHYLENANAAIVEFYREIISAKSANSAR
jgi:glycosyltransferase involved in cell wall biosynthesis